MLIKKINKNTFSRLAVTLSSAGLFVILAALIAPLAPKTDKAEALTSVQDSELSITTDGGASVVLRVNSADGTFASSDAAGNNSARFSVSTTNYTGYTLSLSPSDSGEYADKLTQTIVKNGISTTYAIDSISGAVENGAFDARYNNMWGIMPSKYNSAANANYLPAPTTSVILDQSTSQATNDYTLGLGVRADYSKPAGAYSNTFVLVATANPTTYLAPVSLSEGVKSVKITENGAEVANLTENGYALLTFGTDYVINVEIEDGYELKSLSATAGTLNGTTYRIEPGSAGALSVTAEKVAPVETEKPEETPESD